MHRDNALYGHASVLRRYCGVDDEHGIPGQLQHGWNRGPGVFADRWSTRWPKFLWARRNLEICGRLGFERAVPIGAPFLYLDVDEPCAWRGDRSLLAYPFHGWEREQIREVEDSFEAYARSLEELEREGFGPITVCMYWLEHANPTLRRVFESRGWTVITNGHRDNNPDFLVRLQRSMREHAYVTSNQIGTAVFYALHLRRKTFLRGPKMEVRMRSVANGVDAPQLPEDFDKLAFERFDDRAHPEIAEEELGLEFKLEPTVMRELFRWSPGARMSRRREVEMKAWMQAHRVARQVDRWAGRGVWSR